MTMSTSSFLPSWSSLSSPFRFGRRNRFSLLLLLFFLSLITEKCVASSSAPFLNPEYPSTITLNAGVMHAPPFTVIDEDGDTGNTQFTGFLPDLIDKIKTFALQYDNVTLDIILEKAEPHDYFIALDLIANDCNTTSNAHPLEECNKYDLLIGDYWGAPDRVSRVDFTPAFLQTAFTTVKYLDKLNKVEDYTTISQTIVSDNAYVCILDDLFVINVLLDEYPNTKYITCDSQDACIQMLKNEVCVLFFDEELQLRYASVRDHSLEVTVEKFNTQYIMWPMSYRTVEPLTSLLMKRWMFYAIKTKALDELFHNYFEKQTCPLGTSGENCDQPCNPNHGIDKRGKCICESTRWIGSDCNTEVKENLNMIPNVLKLIGNTMFASNVVLVIGCGIWLFFKKKTIQVRAFQPSFLTLTLLGCLISSSTIIALGQEDAGDGPVHGCMAIPWLYSVGFSITFGTLFAKIRRVYLIFKAAADFKRKEVTVQETLLLIGVVLFIDVLVLIVWTIVDPLEWKRSVVSTDKYGYVLESEGYCTSQHWIIFGTVILVLHFILMGIACILCYVSRDIPTEFSEGKYVAIAMISNLQIFVIGIPVLIILGSDPKTSYFVRSIIVWMNDSAVVILIFGNLIYAVHFGNPNNGNAGNGSNRTSMQSTIGVAIQKYNVSRMSRLSKVSELTTNSNHFPNRSSVASDINNSLVEHSYNDSSGHLNYQHHHHADNHNLKQFELQPLEEQDENESSEFTTKLKNSTVSADSTPTLVRASQGHNISSFATTNTSDSDSLAKKTPSSPQTPTTSTNYHKETTSSAYYFNSSNINTISYAQPPPGTMSDSITSITESSFIDEPSTLTIGRVASNGNNNNMDNYNTDSNSRMTTDSCNALLSPSTLDHPINTNSMVTPKEEPVRLLSSQVHTFDNKYNHSNKNDPNGDFEFDNKVSDDDHAFNDDDVGVDNNKIIIKNDNNAASIKSRTNEDHATREVYDDEDAINIGKKDNDENFVRLGSAINTLSLNRNGTGHINGNDLENGNSYSFSKDNTNCGNPIAANDIIHDGAELYFL